jgi:hypothetical protein
LKSCAHSKVHMARIEQCLDDEMLIHVRQTGGESS